MRIRRCFSTGPLTSAVTDRATSAIVDPTTSRLAVGVDGVSARAWRSGGPDRRAGWYSG
jgi:hypothetical protein